MLDEIGGRPPLAVLQPLLIGEVARLRRGRQLYERFLRPATLRPAAVRPAASKATVAGSGTPLGDVASWMLYCSNPDAVPSVIPNVSAPEPGTVPNRCTVELDAATESTTVVWSV